MQQCSLHSCFYVVSYVTKQLVIEAHWHLLQAKENMEPGMDKITGCVYLSKELFFGCSQHSRAWSVHLQVYTWPKVLGPNYLSGPLYIIYW